MKWKSLLLATAALISVSASAQQSETSGEAKNNARIGRMSLVAFNQINANGARMVSAIKPTTNRLSPTDAQMFKEIALGGMRQLAISQAVLGKATHEHVRLLAQSEVEEQTGISNKLKEIAQAKGMSLPDSLDAESQALVDRIAGMSAEEVNAFYLEESGIKGHQMLQATMTKVQMTARDITLKRIPAATLAVIRTHLTVAKDVQAGLTKSR